MKGRDGLGGHTGIIECQISTLFFTSQETQEMDAGEKNQGIERPSNINKNRSMT